MRRDLALPQGAATAAQPAAAAAAGGLTLQTLADLRLEHERLLMLVGLVQESIGVAAGDAMVTLLLFDLSTTLARHLVNEEQLGRLPGGDGDGPSLHCRMLEELDAIRRLIGDRAAPALLLQRLLILETLLREDIAAFARRCRQIGIEPGARPPYRAGRA